MKKERFYISTDNGHTKRVKEAHLKKMKAEKYEIQTLGFSVAGIYRAQRLHE